MRFRERIGEKLKPVKIPPRAAFPINDQLEQRQVEARARLPVQNVKRLIQEQPDYGEPVDFGELGVIE